MNNKVVRKTFRIRIARDTLFCCQCSLLVKIVTALVEKVGQIILMPA